MSQFREVHRSSGAGSRTPPTLALRETTARREERPPINDHRQSQLSARATMSHKAARVSGQIHDAALRNGRLPNSKARAMPRDPNMAQWQQQQSASPLPALALTVSNSHRKRSDPGQAPEGKTTRPHCTSANPLSGLCGHACFVGEEVYGVALGLHNFTAMIRRRGVVHAASIVVRMRQLVLPLVCTHAAVHVSLMRDEITALFSSPQQALHFACDAIEVADRFNKHILVGDKMADFSVHFSGVGIDTNTAANSGSQSIVADAEGILHGDLARD